MKLLSLVFVYLLSLAGAAHAACPPIPFIFNQGAPFNATQVNTNFASLRDCYNASILALPSPTDVNALALWGNAFGTELKNGTNVPALHRWNFPSSITTATSAFEINVGSYPPSTEIPAAVMQGLTVKVAVPATYTQNPWPPTAISAFITNANANNANATAVALFGFAGTAGDTGAAPGTVTGMNVVASNCAKLTCADGSGFNGAVSGLEVNLDYKKKGAAQPSIGAAHGIRINGGSEVDAISGSFALHIDGLNLFTTPKLPWLYGIFSADGAATTGLFLGRASNSGDGTSQALAFRSRAAGADQDATFVYKEDQYLEFTGTPDLGGIRALNLDARNAFLINGVDAITMGGGCVNFLNGVNGLMALCNTVPENVFRNTSHIFQTLAGAADLFKLQAAGGADTTGMLLTVNNGAGVNLAVVSLGANDSGGVGFKALRVPN
jgi:hypothetical protein